jgi:hypothetical protein
MCVLRAGVVWLVGRGLPLSAISLMFFLRRIPATLLRQAHMHPVRCREGGSAAGRQGWIFQAPPAILPPTSCLFVTVHASHAACCTLCAFFEGARGVWSAAVMCGGACA